jgi:hypothetical protein
MTTDRRDRIMKFTAYEMALGTHDEIESVSLLVADSPIDSAAELGLYDHAYVAHVELADDFATGCVGCGTFTAPRLLDASPAEPAETECVECGLRVVLARPSGECTCGGETEPVPTPDDCSPHREWWRCGCGRLFSERFPTRVAA